MFGDRLICIQLFLCDLKIYISIHAIMLPNLMKRKANFNKSKLLDYFYIGLVHCDLWAFQSSKRLNQSIMVLTRPLLSFKERVLRPWAIASAGVYTSPTCHFGSWSCQEEQRNEKNFRISSTQMMRSRFHAYTLLVWSLFEKKSVVWFSFRVEYLYARRDMVTA